MLELEIVDVVLPFHRDDHFLSKAVESIRNQIGCTVNLILVDDRRDNSKLQLEVPRGARIIKTYGVGYRLALKTGLEQCQARYIAFQDSDDVSLPNRLSMQLRKIVDGEFDLVFCNMDRINSHGRKIRISRPTPQNANSAKEALLIGSYGADSTWLMRRETLTEFFQFSYQSVDWATALIKFPMIRVGSVTENLYLYRKHRYQMTFSSDYYLEAFNEIYPLWLNLNDSLSLPALSKEDAATISFPMMGSKWNSDVQKWTISFLDRIAPFGNHELARFEAILGQRALQSSFHNGATREVYHAKKYVKAFLDFQIKIHPSG